MSLESLPNEMLDTILGMCPRATFAAMAQLNRAWCARMEPRITRELERGLKYYAYREKDWFDGLNWWGQYTYGSVAYKGIYVNLHAGACFNAQNNTTHFANGTICRSADPTRLDDPDKRIDPFRCDIGVINITAFNDIFTWKRVTTEQFIELTTFLNEEYYRDSIGDDPIFVPSDLDTDEEEQADAIHGAALERVQGAIEGKYNGTILVEYPITNGYDTVDNVFFVDEYDGVCDELHRLDVIAKRNGLDIKL